MIGSILSIVDKLLGIAASQIPGFDTRQFMKINDLRTMYDEEMGKSIADIDAAKLDSIELGLRNLVQLLDTAIQGPNHSAQSPSASTSGVSAS
jgi:hypothetical protein